MRGGANNGRLTASRSPPRSARRRRTSLIYACILIVVCLVSLPFILVSSGVVNVDARDTAKEGKPKAMQLVLQYAANRRHRSPMVYPPKVVIGEEPDENQADSLLSLTTSVQGSLLVKQQQPEEEVKNRTDGDDVNQLDERERDPGLVHGTVEDENEHYGGQKDETEAGGTNAQGERDDDATLMGDTNETLFPESFITPSLEENLEGLLKLTPFSDLPFGVPDGRPVDAQGKRLTNGAGVYYRHPFNGRCTTRGAALLSPRGRAYQPSVHVAIIGVMTIDNKDHEQLRMAQRKSWLTYKDVATRSNGFRRRILVEYIVGQAFENKFRFSKTLRREAMKYKDVVGVKLKEIRRRPKNLLTVGKYGRAPEVVMTLKTLAFYCYVEKAYPNAKYVIKADDDQFMRIPVLLKTILTLPAIGVIWGTKNNPRPYWGHKRRFCGTSGMLVGLTQDVLSLVNHYEPVQKFSRINPRSPYLRGLGKFKLGWMFMHTHLFAEDVVAAQVLDSTRMMPQTQYIHFYSEQPCRLHNHNADVTGPFVYFVNPYSMVIHHANHTEQLGYVKLFPESKTYAVQFLPARGDHRCYGRQVYETDVCYLPEAEKPL